MLKNPMQYALKSKFTSILMFLIATLISCSCKKEDVKNIQTFNNKKLEALDFNSQLSLMNDIDYNQTVEFVDCAMRVTNSKDLGRCYEVFYEKTKNLLKDQLLIVDSQEKFEKYCLATRSFNEDEKVKALLRKKDVAYARTNKYIGDPSNKKVTMDFINFYEEFSEKTYTECPEE